MNKIYNKSSDSEKIGILIINLGTPNSTKWIEIYKYLQEFLSDKRVIELNPLLWKLILNIFILPFRTKKTVNLYKKAWLNDINESPLRYYTRKQSEKLQLALEKEYGENIIVDWAMRYGLPSIDSKIKNLKNKGCSKITILPLYPQYSATTTASVCDSVFKSLMKMRLQPSINICPPYAFSEIYINTISKTIQDHISSLDWKAEKILLSFHGLPKKYCDKGDPYREQCQKTSSLIEKKLKYKNDMLITTFQSRFGYTKWLEPYTDEVIKNIALSGVKNIAIICPGFASDCIETIEEICIQAKEIFISNGGKKFTYIPCLNDSEEHIKMLYNLIEKTIHNHI